MTDDPTRKVLPFRPRKADLEATIREIAIADRYVYLGPHAKERMEERGITRPEALRVLRVAYIEGEIEQGREAGEWKCKVVGNVKGSREIGVVTVVIDGRRIFVKTVEWEDLK